MKALKVLPVRVIYNAFTSVKEDVFHSPFFCLYVCYQFNLTTADRIFMKILPDDKTHVLEEVESARVQISE